MNTQANGAQYRRLLIGGVAAILLGSSGIAAVKAWMPGSTEVAAADELPAPQQADRELRVRVKCAECGIVESTREIAQSGGGRDRGPAGRATKIARNEIPVMESRRYEITVRMQDGASRVFTEANPSNWRPGERVTLIEGAD